MRIYFLVLIFLILRIAEGQIPERLYFNHLTQSNGLSQTFNYYIYQDSYGFVWMSSLNGLNRYDGKEIRVYKYQSGDSTSLSDNNIQSEFVEDRDANLWFTTYDGLVCYDRKHDIFQTYPFTKDSVKLKGYYLALENRGRNVGVIIEDKYFRSFDIYERKWLKTPLDTFPTKTQRVFPFFDASDSLKGLISYEGDLPGFYFFDFRAKEKSYYEHRFDGKSTKEPAFRINDILNLDDTLLIAGNEGYLIYSSEDTNWQFKPTNQFDPIRLAKYKKDNILVATNDGGWKITKLRNILSGKQNIHKPNDQWSLASNNLNGVWSYDDGTIWSGVSGIGVDFTQPEKVKFKKLDIGEQFGFVDQLFNVRTIIEDQFGNIWGASRGGGVFVLSPSLELLSHFHSSNQHKNKLFSNDVFNIFLDDEERCWVFTYSSFGVIERKARGFEFAYIEKEVFLYGIKLQDGRVLFSSLNGGVYQLDDSKGDYDFKLIPQIDTLSPYTHMYQSKSGLLFLDKNISSILILDPENNFKLAGPELKIKGEVICYYEEPNSNIIWIATKNGLVRLDPDDDWHWDIFTEVDGLPDQQIYAVLGDDSGCLWLTTNRGMVRFDPKSSHFHAFSMYDGLQGLEFNSFSFMERSNGEFWFGGNSGINYFHPDSIKYLDVLANPTITAIEINDKPSPDYLEDVDTKATNVSLINKIVLDHYQNDLSIKIAALEYSDPASNLYEFKMVAGQDTIVRKGKKSTFEYPNMQPGNYTLYYNASNSDGIWAKPKKLEILINPPWYETLWARILFAIAGLTLIYAYYRYRIAQIRKEETFKRKEAEFRQKEAEYKQLVAETETAVLRLQMNPHFIFNSMNSINSYILKRDVDTASDYLNRFATLMRMILKFAAKKLIAVSDEIELLDLYLQTEAMRFEKKFTYSFDLKDDLDPDEFLIPTMILQPFVENAIWHGLSSKKEGEGVIKICFWEEGDSFFCSIADNGIGRQASRESSFKAKTHESKALSITEHRLQLLEKKNDVTASFEIQDMMDNEQKPIGTKVILRFPIF